MSGSPPRVSYSFSLTLRDPTGARRLGAPMNPFASPPRRLKPRQQKALKPTCVGSPPHPEERGESPQGDLGAFRCREFIRQVSFRLMGSLSKGLRGFSQQPTEGGTRRRRNAAVHFRTPRATQRRLAHHIHHTLRLWHSCCMLPTLQTNMSLGWLVTVIHDDDGEGGSIWRR